MPQLLPTLVVVGGPAGGYGKTTLAHQLADAICCPAICRDEIKEGMVHNAPGFVPAPGDPLTQRAAAAYVPISLPAPTLEVDTTDGYAPALDEIVNFVNQGVARL